MSFINQELIDVKKKNQELVDKRNLNGQVLICIIDEDNYIITFTLC